MKKKQKKLLIRIIISSALFIALLFLPSGYITASLYVLAYVIIGYDIVRKAVKGIGHGRVFDENFLMVVATLGAFALSIVEKSFDFRESVAVMLFYQVGEFFQSVAVAKSRKSIAELMDIRPDYANIEIDGALLQVDPNEVQIGDTIIVQPGEKIPIDGVILSGETTLNTSALTGESLPIDVSAGDEVVSGSINLSGVIRVKTDREFCNSTVSKILELTENASSRKSKSENFISKFALVYTPVVCGLALLLFLVPPVASYIIAGKTNFSLWGYRALTFLVTSCPCALVISIPLTFFAGIGGASAKGILIKGSNYLEGVSKLKQVVLDKTGTLTKGVFEVTDIISDNENILEYAAYAECASSHPISKSIREAYGKDIDRSRVADITELSGRGVVALFDGKEVAVGNVRLMDSLNIEYALSEAKGTSVLVAVDKKFIGEIIISDVIKATSKEAIDSLKKMGIKTVMLTGDRPSVAKDVAEKLGIEEYHASLMPADKVSKVEKLLPNGSLAFVGDGINDAPVLSRADIGFAMGSLGSDAAIEAADVVIMDDDPKKICKAIKISKRCLSIVYQNIVFALFIKTLCLVLSAVGITNMWFAIFADVGVMVIAVLNALRALKNK